MSELTSASKAPCKGSATTACSSNASSSSNIDAHGLRQGFCGDKRLTPSHEKADKAAHAMNSKHSAVMAASGVEES